MANLTAVLGSEWTKVKSVKSTVVSLVAAFVLTVGVGALFCLLINSQWSKMSPADRATFDATSTSFSGIQFGQLALIAFGVLVISNEYTSGMIRVSLAAVPQRGMLMLCKVLVVLLLVLPISLATSFASFFLGQALLGKHGTTIGATDVLRAVLGMAIYMTLLCLLTLGVTMMLRKPLISMGLLMPFFFLVSPILAAVPKAKVVARYFPDTAGSQMVHVQANSDIPYGPLAGFLICLAWVVACLIGGYVLLKRRDA